MANRWRNPHHHTRHSWKSRTYRSWEKMRQRCHAENHNYSGRGIRICERWEKFENFLADMGERPLETTLDRIDNEGHYEPGNCRWASKLQQDRNRRTTTVVTLNGRRVTLPDLADELGVKRDALYHQIRTKGLSTELAVKAVLEMKEARAA